VISRRQLISHGLCGGLLCGAGSIGAKPLPTNLQPLLESNYQPSDADERGLWHSLERFEEDLSTSGLLLQAPELKAYTLAVLERLLGRPVTDMRIYLVRDASFNASMFPSGMMLVHSGLIVRARSEAQYASVLGHEAGHYFRKHSLEGFRNLKRNAAVAAFVAAGANVAAGTMMMSGYDGSSWIDMANSINASIVASVYRFGRDQESEADAYGISLLAKAGYAPSAAASIWRQLIDERTRSAVHRKKKYNARASSLESTHPPMGSRMEALVETADVLGRDVPADQYSENTEAWRNALAPHLLPLLEEQVKLNEPGASLHIIEGLAQSGWNGILRFQEGEVYRLRNEPGDPALASRAFAEAVTLGDAPPEAWRAHGYALLKEGRGAEGREALARYIDLKPDAKDAAMVRVSLATQ
jgi:beta-barrel assembly-enhancing protease